MEQLQGILQFVVAGNTVLEWIIAAAVFLGIVVALHIARKVIVTRFVKISKKTSSKVDDVVSGFLDGIRMPIYVLVGLFVAVQGVSLPDSLNLILDIALLVVIVSQVIKLLEEVLSMALVKYLQKTNPTAVLPGIFRVAIRMLLWSVGFLMILSNIGIDITSLVAGLGIGGLAISLALQNILTDMFSSFSIAVDKPFEVGDFIVVGDHKGTVKYIGMKTTRITALQGEEVVVSNTELTSARVENYKKMQRRRIVMEIGVTYETPVEKLKKIDGIIERIITSKDHADFDRVHFHTFGDSNLVFEIVYYMTSSEYKLYMDTQQAINFEILEAFEQEGIDMAYPTQTIYMKKE